jgi:hypothetical protein
MRVEHRELSFLREVAAANDVGMGFRTRPNAITRLERESRMIGGLIGHGLLEERARLQGTEAFFSPRPRSYLLYITPLGRECCEALRANWTVTPPPQL